MKIFILFFACLLFGANCEASTCVIDTRSQLDTHLTNYHRTGNTGHVCGNIGTKHLKSHTYFRYLTKIDFKPQIRGTCRGWVTLVTCSETRVVSMEISQLGIRRVWQLWVESSRVRLLSTEIFQSGIRQKWRNWPHPSGGRVRSMEIFQHGIHRKWADCTKHSRPLRSLMEIFQIGMYRTV